MQKPHYRMNDVFYLVRLFVISLRGSRWHFNNNFLQTI